MGDDHDSREPSDVVPDATVRICAILSQGCCTEGSHDGPYLPRDHTVRVDSGRRARVAGPVPRGRDDPAEFDRKLGRFPLKGWALREMF